MENDQKDMSYRKITKVGDDAYAAYALAKLNISLSIGKREETGFHKLSTVMQTISLHDYITLTRVSEGEEGISGYFVKDNIIAKAIDELSKKAGKELYCRINIVKTIPVAAGMGGGSSDAAAVLRIANVAFGLNMKLVELEEVARKVGNDVSFLLHGGRALVEGGEAHQISHIEVPNLHYVIARPKMKLGTKEMYELHDKTGKDFTELASELCPDTRRLLAQIRESETLECGVTGKGPTVFGAYRSYKECEKVAEKICWLDGEIFIERAIDKFI